MALASHQYEFAKFARDWDFIHVTSSPHYARSNGLAERAVGIVKELFAKCKDAGVTEAEAMLNHRNTPNASGISPAQMMTDGSVKNPPRYATRIAADERKDN
jgi:transposase